MSDEALVVLINSSECIEVIEQRSSVQSLSN